VTTNGVNLEALAQQAAQAAAAPPQEAQQGPQFTPMGVALSVAHARMSGPEIAGNDTGDRVILSVSLALTRDQAAGVINALAAAHRMCSPLIIPT
jgi:hypothetical protein